jgi:Arc/MetJ-type ribon-helix-helix transcriptional regulator
MQVHLTKPELARFVDAKVKAGEFPSAQAVVEDALVRMMEEEQETLTEDDLRAIQLADEAMDRGEHVDFEAFADEMRKKFGVK